jgi:hypothetical protein
VLLSRGRRLPSFVAIVVPFVLAGAVIAAGPAAAARAATTPAADSAAFWLEAQLSANADVLPGPFGGQDIGLTEDAILGLTAAGHGEDATTRAATAQVEAGLGQFVTVGVPGLVLAGSVAKSALVAEGQGADVTAFGGRDLEQDLRSIMTASGALAGRFADQGNIPDSSNGFSQALGILALARTSGGVPTAAVTFLLAQQCPSGAFRLFYDSGSSCTDNAQADTDATGLAVQALAAAPSSATVTTAVGHAVTWLAGQQDAGTGALSSSGPAAQPNSNSTGLGVIALRLGGQSAAAAKGEGYVEGLQLTCGPGQGGIAFDSAAHSAAASGAIPASDLDQWRRATAQAVLALGVPGYGEMTAVPAGTSRTPNPPTTTPCGAPTTSPSSTPSGSHSSSHSSSHSGVPSGSASVLGAQLSAAPALAATGGLDLRLALLGALVLLAGLGLIVVGTDRRARHR